MRRGIKGRRKKKGDRGVGRRRGRERHSLIRKTLNYLGNV